MRAELRRVRRNIPPSIRRSAAILLKRRIAQSHLFFRAKRLGFYLAFDGEMTMAPLIKWAATAGKRCYLPRVPQGAAKILSFTEISAATRKIKNRYGILEYIAPRTLRARELDVLFVPLVGFDKDGARLGMGAGYYDASLAYLKQRRVWRKPRLFGIGFECQKREGIPRDAWDVLLDGIFTEARFYSSPTH